MHQSSESLILVTLYSTRHRWITIDTSPSCPPLLAKHSNDVEAFTILGQELLLYIFPSKLYYRHFLQLLLILPPFPLLLSFPQFFLSALLFQHIRRDPFKMRSVAGLLNDSLRYFLRCFHFHTCCQVSFNTSRATVAIQISGGAIKSYIKNNNCVVLFIIAACFVLFTFFQWIDNYYYYYYY